MPHLPTSELLQPVSIQLSEMNSLLNSVMLTTFFMGIYTIIYFGTLYLCYYNGSQGRIIVAALTMLYVLNMWSFGLEWWYLKWSFLDNGESRDTIYISIFNLPRGAHVMSSILAFSAISVADGLLVWRCFYAWNRSLRVISIPVLLMATEIGLFLSSVIALFAEKLRPSLKVALVVNHLDGAGYFVSAATSLGTTFLIAYRIYCFSGSDGISTSKTKFKRIIAILIESAMIYSVSMLIQALATVLPFVVTDTRFFAFNYYSNNLFIPFSGIAPTVMVARVCLAVDDNHQIPATNQVSILEFRRPSAIRKFSDPGGIDRVLVTDSDSDNTPVAEGEKALV